MRTNIRFNCDGSGETTKWTVTGPSGTDIYYSGLRRSRGGNVVYARDPSYIVLKLPLGKYTVITKSLLYTRWSAFYHFG